MKDDNLNYREDNKAGQYTLLNMSERYNFLPINKIQNEISYNIQDFSAHIKSKSFSIL